MKTLPLLLLPALAFAAPKVRGAKPGPALYRIPVTAIDGRQGDLSRYRGKVLLIVNTASKCGFTPQYEGLQGLHETFGPKGLVVLGVPSNDFRGQEPGDETEIKRFCELRYKVGFPMLAKTIVLGPRKHALYRWLTENAPETGEVGWNFEKFLIGRDGKIVGRYPSKIKPESAELTGAIERLL